MKVSIIAAAAALFALASAAPTPQDFDGDFIDSIPPPTAEGAPAGATKSGPDVDVDALVESTVSDISKRWTISKRGVASDNFVKVFDNWTGSTQTGGYLTFKLLPSYDVDLCATKCLANTGCVFFNIYDETNPAGILHKCALYSIASTKGAATNFGGQDHNGVISVKSLSAGYKKKALQEDVPGYHYECFGDASINAPQTGPVDPYMGVSFTTTSPSVCAAACDAKTAYNLKQAPANGTYRACNFFDFYNVYRDGVPYQTACTFYLISYDSTFATNFGQKRNGYQYSIGESCGYTRDVLIGVDGIATKGGVARA
ncbi:hypothetical protein TWF718_003356 [Orbilia javanica]|uniref:Uncharacterized protein n=1 Tax=Orbilia javanica TaxID=47235 RepID=A0AAN8MLV3_9PEZI